MYQAGQRWNNPNSVNFVFDAQGELGYEAASWYLEMKESFPSETRRYFGNSPVSEDDALVLPLQAADMLAWFQRRRVCKPVIRPGMLKIEELITEGFAVGSDIEADGFEKAAIPWCVKYVYADDGLTARLIQAGPGGDANDSGWRDADDAAAGCGGYVDSRWRLIRLSCCGSRGYSNW